MTTYLKRNIEVKTNSSFYIFYPEKLKKKIKLFQKKLNGKILYAVKANPLDLVINQMLKSKISSFDVASLSEIKLIRNNFQEAEIFFMNPVKARFSINQAYTAFMLFINRSI